MIFGGVTMLAGMIGVPMGALLSTWLRQKYPRADPLICGIGLVVSAIFVACSFVFARKDVRLAFALVFIGEVALDLNWSVVADILLVRPLSLLDKSRP
jgi:hypothetical protein